MSSVDLVAKVVGLPRAVKPCLPPLEDGVEPHGEVSAWQDGGVRWRTMR